MPLPLFLPCAAGVEALLDAEVKALLPGVAVHASRGGVALDGEPRDVMRLNLESRLAQRVLIEVAEGAYRDETDLYALAHGAALQGHGRNDEGNALAAREEGVLAHGRPA